MNLELPKASVEWKSKGFEIVFEHYLLPQYGIDTLNYYPVPTDEYFDASIPISWTLSLTTNTEQAGGESQT